MSDELPGGIIPLPTADPLLCAREDKAALETKNCVEQLAYVEHLVVDYKIHAIRESHVLELQRLAVEGLYPCGAQYRKANRTAKLDGGGATHVLPEPATIPGHVRHALERINDRNSGHVLERAAYALWRFNWIHPFAGGNGRTSRALAYLILSVDFGRCIPGRPSFPTIISHRQDDYIAGLRDADKADVDGREDLARMTKLVAEATIALLESLVAESKAREAKK